MVGEEAAVVGREAVAISGEAVAVGRAAVVGRGQRRLGRRQRLGRRAWLDIPRVRRELVESERARREGEGKGVRRTWAQMHLERGGAGWRGEGRGGEGRGGVERGGAGWRGVGCARRIARRGVKSDPKGGVRRQPLLQSITCDAPLTSPTLSPNPSPSPLSSPRPPRSSNGHCTSAT